MSVPVRADGRTSPACLVSPQLGGTCGLGNSRATISGPTPERCSPTQRLIILRMLRRMSSRPGSIPAPIRRQRVGPVGRPDGGHLHRDPDLGKQPAPTDAHPILTLE